MVTTSAEERAGQKWSSTTVPVSDVVLWEIKFPNLNIMKRIKYNTILKIQRQIIGQKKKKIFYLAMGMIIILN